MARRMVLEVFPLLAADYRRERLLTVEQVRSLIKDTGRNPAHALCFARIPGTVPARSDKRLSVPSSREDMPARNHADHLEQLLRGSFEHWLLCGRQNESLRKAIAARHAQDFYKKS
jgi:hypothetical protein